MKPKMILAMLFSVFFYCSICGQQTFKIVLETDFDGNVVSGSKKELIKEIRKGKPVRVGWQLDFDNDNKPDFDHWMDAEFITILDDEVFTQIRNINLQVPKLDIPQVDIISTNTMWTGILGTNGLLINRFVYGELKYDVDTLGNPIMTEELEKELARRETKTWKVATFWVVERK